MGSCCSIGSSNTIDSKSNSNSNILANNKNTKEMRKQNILSVAPIENDFKNQNNQVDISREGIIESKLRVKSEKNVLLIKDK